MFRFEVRLPWDVPGCLHLTMFLFGTSGPLAGCLYHLKVEGELLVGTLTRHRLWFPGPIAGDPPWKLSFPTPLSKKRSLPVLPYRVSLPIPHKRMLSCTRSQGVENIGNYIEEPVPVAIPPDKLRDQPVELGP